MTLSGPPVEAVLLDYGGTLVSHCRPEAALTIAYGAIARLLGERLGVEAPGADRLLHVVHDRVEAALADHEASGSLREVEIAALHRQAYADFGLTVTDELLDEVQTIEQRAWWEGMTVVPSAPSVLLTLRSAGVPVGLCSNAPYHSASMRAQLDHLGLGRLLDSVTLSSEVGWRKPAPEIFAQALADLGARAATTVMVGDRLIEDVAGARAAGLRGVLITENCSASSPQSGQADAVVDRLEDLLGLLDLRPKV